MNAIVVGTDGSEQAIDAVRQAGRLALRTGATLYVAAGYKPERTTLSDRASAPADIAHRLEGTTGALHDVLDATAAALRADGVPVLTWGSPEAPWHAIRALARHVEADVVVCGPELRRINDGRDRAPRKPLAERLSRRARWDVHDLTVATPAVTPQPVARVRPVPERLAA